jgi:hypothetical protein
MLKRHWSLVVVLGLVVTSIVYVYAPVVRTCSFMFDDWYKMEYASQKTLAEQLSEFSPLSPETQALGNATWWVFWRLFHLNSVPYHIAVILLHVICTLLIFGAGRELGLSFCGGTVAATLFGLHPAMFETVDWISPATEYSYSLIFSLLSLLLFLRGVIRPAAIRWIYVSFSVVFYFLAVKSKMQSHFLPVLFFCVVAGSEGMRARSWKEYIRKFGGSILPQLPYWAISVTSIVSIYSHGGPGGYRMSGTGANILHNFRSYLTPISLWYAPSMPSVAAAIMALLLCGGTIIICTVAFRGIARGSAMWNNSRKLLWNTYICWLWAWLSFLPVVFLVDHASPGHNYLPVAGFALFIGVVVGGVFGRIPRLAAVAVPALFLWVVEPIFVKQLNYSIPVWARNQTTLVSLQSLHPQLPANAHLYVYPSPPAALFDSGNGSAVRLIYEKPISVTLGENESDVALAMAGIPAVSVPPGDTNRAKFYPGTQVLYLLHYDVEGGNLEDVAHRSGEFNPVALSIKR